MYVLSHFDWEHNNTYLTSKTSEVNLVAVDMPLNVSEATVSHSLFSNVDNNIEFQGLGLVYFC
jgi:hypothetical protein